MAGDDLYDLELLSLVAKITQEINNYIGFNDKTLAEFVISLHDEANGDLNKFKQKLRDMEAGFPDSFMESVDRLILTMHPKYKKKKDASGSNAGDEPMVSEEDRKRRMFPGLALQNKEVEPLADDVFLKELGDIVTGKTAKKRSADVEPPRSGGPMDVDPPSKRRRRSPSPGRGRRDDRRYGREQPDEKPVLFKIYNGKVSGIKDFGAFVTLEGVMGRAEGRPVRFATLAFVV